MRSNARSNPPGPHAKAGTWRAEFHPRTPSETFHVDIMIRAEWSKRRLQRAEADLYCTVLTEAGTDNLVAAILSGTPAAKLLTRVQRQIGGRLLVLETGRMARQAVCGGGSLLQQQTGKPPLDCVQRQIVAFERACTELNRSRRDAQTAEDQEFETFLDRTCSVPLPTLAWFPNP